MNNPIFIVGPHKSGTTLLLRLLDDHPELFSIPFETHIFQLSGRWVDYRGRKTYPQYLSFKEIKDSFKKHIKKINTVKQDFSHDSSSRIGMFNLSIFNQKIEKEVDNFKDLVELYFQAIYSSFYEEDYVETKRFVEKSVEHDEFVPLLKKLFPDAKFIRVLRNPYSNLVSYRRYLQKAVKKGKYPKISVPLLSLKNSFYHMYRNLELFPDSYHVIKYENILTNPEKSMKELADFIGVKYDPILLKPTIKGKLWLGNSSLNKQFHGISADNLDVWKKEINTLEKYYITKYFRKILQDYDYPVLPQPRKSRFLPVKKEKLFTYIFNRSLDYNVFM